MYKKETISHSIMAYTFALVGAYAFVLDKAPVIIAVFYASLAANVVATGFALFFFVKYMVKTFDELVPQDLRRFVFPEEGEAGQFRFRKLSYEDDGRLDSFYWLLWFIRIDAILVAVLNTLGIYVLHQLENMHLATVVVFSLLMGMIAVASFAFFLIIVIAPRGEDD